MLPYFIVLVFVMLLLFMASNNRFNRPNKFPYYLSGFVLVLLATVRSNKVGTDSGNYTRMFIKSGYNTESIFTRDTSIEIGYLFLEKLALIISKDYWSLFFVIATLSVLATYYAIYKLSGNIKLSVFIYISLATFLFFFNGARQAIAASVIGVAIYYLMKEKIMGYVICVIIASLFHKTALIMLPFYFLLRFKFSIRNMILFSAGSFLALYYFSTIISLFDSGAIERYSVYENRNATGGYALTFFFFVVSFILIFLRRKILKSKLKEYDVYLNMCVFSSLIYLVVTFTGSDVNFLRLSLFFSMGYILIWPIVFKSVPIFKTSIFRAVFVIIHLLFYYVYLIKMSGLNPYIFNDIL